MTVKRESAESLGYVEIRDRVDRRRFLTAATAIASAAALGDTTSEDQIRSAHAASDRHLGPEPLELQGGTSVRSTMLVEKLPGPQYYCVAVTSGTTALMTAMAGPGVGPGDEVILPAWTWYACYDGILAAGALPVFAEVDESMNLDPTDIEHRITPQTKVIMAVHILGAPADMDSILAVARKRNLKLLEDCAQSVGVTYKGRPVGSMGDCGIYSFQINKTISAGEGGAVVTSDPHVFERGALS